ncbi:MAG: alkaline phosphatase family protein [Vicinamibacteria bacterium]
MTRGRLLRAPIGLAVLALLSIGAFACRRQPAIPAGPLVVPAIARAAVAGRPVLFVGLDGADWQLLDDYLASGAMPNLARLVAEGAGGVLETLHPPLSPLVWTTMLTGMSPVDHGILDFTRFNPGTGAKEPITSEERRVPAVWNVASAAGRSVAVFGLWATHPADEVNGLLVSDRLFSFLYGEDAPPAGAVFPASEQAPARAALADAEKRIGYEALKAYLPWLERAEYDRRLAEAGRDPYAHPVSALRRILVETEVYHSLATGRIRQRRPDFALVYLQGTDSVGHVFAPFAPPRLPQVSERDQQRYGKVPELYFRYVDGLLGEYRRLAEERGAVLVLASDHGFFWKEGRPTELSSFAHATAGKWHRKEGIFLLWGPGIAARPGHPLRGSVGQTTATLLALLGLPRGLGLLGPPLADLPATPGEALDYAALLPRPKAALAGGAGAAATSAASSGTASVANAEAIEKLKALGYIGVSESAQAPDAVRRAGGTRTAGAYNNAGLIFRDQGKSEAAKAAFEKALEIDPGLGSALWNLSDLLFQQKRDLARSDALLLQAFAAGVAETRRYLVERAVQYERGGDGARSRDLMERAVAARPDEPVGWLFRGRYRVGAGDCAGAAGDFEKAIALDPKDAAAHASLGLARLCLGDREGARRALLRSLAIDPQQPRVREALARM